MATRSQLKPSSNRGWRSPGGQADAPPGRRAPAKQAPSVQQRSETRSESWRLLRSRSQTIASAVFRVLNESGYTFWEAEIRPRLAAAISHSANEITSDIMGDLREIRHSILHANGILIPKYHKKLKKLHRIFEVNHPIVLPCEVMHQPKNGD